jgi:hypothetical protein
MSRRSATPLRDDVAEREFIIEQGAASFVRRPASELEAVAGALINQANVCSGCGWPEEWTTPLKNAAVLLAEAAAFKMHAKETK